MNKPSGLLVHPSGGLEQVTCLSLLSELLDSQVYPVHRLDRLTTGVLVFALTTQAARELNRQFAERTVSKRYLALVKGFTTDEVCRQPLKGKAATTVMRVISRAEVITEHRRFRFSLLEARPQSGYFHQVRRHCKGIRCPVVGDRRRGDKTVNRWVRERHGFSGMALHAAELRLGHPTTGEELVLCAPAPGSFRDLVNGLGL